MAKELDLDNKVLMDLLLKRGYAVKSVSSTIDNISAESIRAEFAKKNTGAAPAAPTVDESPKPPSIKPHIPGGAIVRSAEDISKERAARAETMKPKTFPSISAAYPTLRPGSPPPIKISPVAAGPSMPPAVPSISAVRPSALPAAPVIRPAAPPKVAVPQILRTPVAHSTGSVLTHSSSAGSAISSGTSIPARPSVSSTTAKTPPATPASEAPIVVAPVAGEIKVMQIKPPIMVRDFAVFLGLKPFKLISSLMEMGIFASMNQILEPDLASKVAEKFGVVLEIKHRGESKVEPPKKKELPKVDEKLLMELRPPVVCVLGHVDHGKTTLVDFIRKTNVVAGEAGGITQHIGAYQIVVPPSREASADSNKDDEKKSAASAEGRKITFLDTPGHSAFEKMRERGASLTDIAVLVIAADDGFKPQTDEALKHCRKHAVPVIVAINKIDVKGANIDRVKKQMQERNLLPEDWGGDVITVPISALKGEHIDTLLEMILLQADILELKANPKAGAEGVIVESKIEVGRGPTATVIVQKGTLKPGDAIVCGPSYCKVKSLLNERDEKLDKASPSTPVRIIGWSQTPEVGGRFITAKNEREAKDMAETAAQEILKTKRSQQATAAPQNAKELLEAITAQTSKSLSVVVKADVSGSLEAVIDALRAITSDKVKLEIVGGSVGLVSLGDVEMAHTSKASIVAFNTRNDIGVAAALKHDHVSVISHNIIYELVEQVKDAMAELLDPILTEHSLGKAEIRQIFALSKGTIAGCMVTEGSIMRDKQTRVWRGKELLGEGKIVHLKRQKDDASEVKAGFECGILFSGIDSFKEGDVVECYEISKMKAAL